MDHGRTVHGAQARFMYLATLPAPASPDPPHTVAGTYYLGGGFSEQTEIDFYVEVSPWHDKLVEAEMLFASQSHDEAFARRRVDAEAGNAGWMARTRYAEDYQRVGAELFDRLPVPAVSLAHAAGRRTDVLKRMSGTLEADPNTDEAAPPSLRIMVVTAHPHDFTHCAATCEALIHAARPDYETKRRPHTVAAAYYLGAFFETNEIDFYVDVSNWVEKRVQAEAMFLSQSHSEAFARRRVELHAGRNGWVAGVFHAEDFVRAGAEVFNHLPVPSSALRPRRPHENDAAHRG